MPSRIWLLFTLSDALYAAHLTGLTRPPLAAQCPLRRPGVGVVLLSHCWLWGRGGVGDAVHAPPPCCLSWVPQGGRRTPHLAPVPMRHPPHAHWSHPYPLLRRTSSSFVVVYISNSYSRFLPRSPSLRCLIVSPSLAHSTPRSSFIPWLHRAGTFLIGTIQWRCIGGRDGQKGLCPGTCVYHPTCYRPSGVGVNDPPSEFLS